VIGDICNNCQTMSYQNNKGTVEGYPPPGYTTPYPYPPPGYQGPSAPGYPYPPPPPGYQLPPDQTHCCQHGPPQGYQQGYQGYFNPGYPPQQYPTLSSPDPQRGYTGFLEGCMAALCCCCLLEECCSWYGINGYQDNARNNWFEDVQWYARIRFGSSSLKLFPIVIFLDSAKQD